MKSLKQKLKKQEASNSPTDWNKYDERLLKAVESGDVDKVTNTLKKGAVASKLDANGRSSLHLAAGGGLINSLNVFLAHGVNLRTADAAGKTALHLSSRGGHSVCVQRLVQSKSPVDSTDLQGRTALHEAALAGHTTIIKLLCDSGASVNSVDKDNHTPLMVAAQMGQSRACQQLLNCGASVNLRDKQNKTALILACEHVHPEVVEVLLKHKADVTALDMHGHDSCHYARLSGDQAIILVIKQALDASSKEASKSAMKLQQQSSVNNETHALVRKISVQASAKSLSSGVCCPTTVPPSKHTKEHRSHTENGKEILPSYHSDCAQVRHHGAHSIASTSFKSKEVMTGEADLLKRELWETRRRHMAVQDELLRLEAVLVMRTQDYEELRRSSERALQQAHNRSWELEEALGEVQRRMAGSEARVRQMQAHLVNMRETLVEESRVQLLEAKTELHRAHEELGQSKREAEKHKASNDKLLQEVHKLTEELQKKTLDTNALQERLERQDDQRTVTACKEIQTPPEWKPCSSRTTMTDLTGEILQRELDKKSYIRLEQHESIKNSLTTALQQAQNQAQDELLRQQKTSEENQSLIRELQEQRTELDTLQEALQARFVPVAMLEAKEKEVTQLKLALKEIEKSKETNEDTKKTSVAEVKKKFKPDQFSQNNTCTQNGRPSEKPTTTSVNLKEETRRPDAAQEQNKDSEIIVEAEGSRATENSSSAPSSVCSLVHSDCTILQEHINTLQQQLENSEKNYRQVLGKYRSRLLSAAQGYMDEEARSVLLQIAQMRLECVC